MNPVQNINQNPKWPRLFKACPAESNRERELRRQRAARQAQLQSKRNVPNPVLNPCLPQNTQAPGPQSMSQPMQCTQAPGSQSVTPSLSKHQSASSPQETRLAVVHRVLSVTDNKAPEKKSLTRPLQTILGFLNGTSSNSLQRMRT